MLGWLLMWIVANTIVGGLGLYMLVTGNGSRWYGLVVLAAAGLPQVVMFRNLRAWWHGQAND